MTRALKFCMVTTFYPPYHFGGDGIFVYRLAQQLAGLGHEVDVVHSVDAFRLGGGKQPKPPLSEHRSVTRIGIQRKLFRTAALAAHQTGSPALYARELRGILEGGRYDVINYHNISLLGGPDILAYGSAAKLYTTHEYWLVCPTQVLFKYKSRACETKNCLSCTLWYRRPPQFWRNTALLQDSVNHVDRFIFPSNFAQDQHERGGLSLPAVVLPHFVPMPDNTVTLSEKRGASAHGYFLFVGRLEKLKGLQDILGHFSGRAGPELWIAGSGNYENDLRRKARRLARVRFLGQVREDELAALYQNAIAVVAPSLCYEVFHLAAAEALAHGTPVIARDLGAVPELIHASGGGILFRSVEEFSAAANSLAGDKEMRARLSAKAREAAPRLWSPAVYMTRYLALVNEVLNEATVVPAPQAGLPSANQSLKKTEEL